MEEAVERKADAHSAPGWWRWFWPVTLIVVIAVEVPIVVQLIKERHDPIASWVWVTLLMAWPGAALLCALVLWVAAGEVWEFTHRKLNR